MAYMQLSVRGSSNSIHITTVPSTSETQNHAEILFSNSRDDGIGSQEVSRGVFFEADGILAKYRCIVLGHPAKDTDTLISALKKADKEGKQHVKMRAFSASDISVDTIIEALVRFADEYVPMNIHCIEVNNSFVERLRETEKERTSQMWTEDYDKLSKGPIIEEVD